MSKKQDFDSLVDEIIICVGGRENIDFLTHCMTRLRFNIKDRQLIDLAKIKSLPKIMGAQWYGDQLQIIIGQNVGDVCQLIAKKIGLVDESKSGQFNEEKSIEETANNQKKSIISAIFDGFTGCITPLLPLMIGAGLIKIVALVLNQADILSIDSSSYIVLNFAGDAGFYFLPVFVGATAARKFGGNMGLGMLIGAILIHPDLMNVISSGELSLFTLPIYPASYAYTIFPTIIAIYVMSKVENFVIKFSPTVIRSILDPLVTLLVMIPVTLWVIAPIGAILGGYLTDGIMWIYNAVGFLGVAIMSMLWPLMVLTGMHSAIVPYQTQSFAILKYEPIALTAILISNFNQGAASAAVGFKTKDLNLKSSALSCSVTAIVAGVTEPAMFGINLRLKKPMIAAMIGSFIGAGIAGFFKVYAYAFLGSAGIFGLPVFLSDNIMNLVWMLVGSLVGMMVTFILTLFLYKDSDNT